LIVLDASEAVAVYLNLGPTAGNIRLRISLPGESLHVPHLFDVEVLHVLRRHSFTGGPLTADRERLVLDRFKSTRLSRYAHATFLERIWELKDNLSAYDAAYVALAEALSAPLVTTDARLARAPGIRAEVEVYG
jgi:predicted nucleic acid-binding protein